MIQNVQESHSKAHVVCNFKICIYNNKMSLVDQSYPTIIKQWKFGIKEQWLRN
jgi:hypothetical protein